jgi:amino acid transporter
VRRGANGLDVYGWMGSLATYGFIVTYGLVCIALPRYLRDHHGVVNAATKAIPWMGVVAMLLALAGNLYPVPQGPYGKLPYIYLVYLFVVLMWFVVRSRPKPTAQDNSEC